MLDMQYYNNLPISFQINQGQSSPEVKFLAHGSGYNMFFTPSKTIISLRQREDKIAEKSINKSPKPIKNHYLTRKNKKENKTIEIRLNKANKHPKIEGLEKLPGKVNYFLGNDPSKWYTDIPTFSKIEYHDVYPGIHAICYGINGKLEYDYIVSPNADPQSIVFDIQGADKLKIADTGDLILQIADSEFHFKKPYIYQEVDGVKNEISGSYKIKNGSMVGFKIGRYNTSLQLIIDPILEYSTYLGGSGDDAANCIVIDSVGNAYITGTTGSSDFPGNPLLPAPTDSANAFVAKISSTGSELIYSTYFGGNGEDNAYGIAVDSEGNAYITGSTNSTDFPKKSPIQSELGGDLDAFITKINSDGSELIFSTYVGGKNRDEAYSIAIDMYRNAYVTGYTYSDTFPVENPLQSELSGTNDAFITCIKADGSELIYSTYFGGDEDEYGLSIDVDTACSAYITGYTFSKDFPTKNAIQTIAPGDMGAFVSKFTFADSQLTLAYSTYLGGNGGYNISDCISVDSSGNAYITGFTDAADFPVMNPIQSDLAGIINSFITKIDSSGSKLLFSTYLGGNASDYASSIAIDSASNVYVTGYTFSEDFPTKNAIQADISTLPDMYVAKLNSSGSELMYSTFIGGADEDTPNSIAVDRAGNAYITGTTSSSDFPLNNALQTTLNGTSDIIICKIGLTQLEDIENSISNIINKVSDINNTINSLSGKSNNFENLVSDFEFKLASINNEQANLYSHKHKKNILQSLSYFGSGLLTTGAVIRDDLVNSLVISISNDTAIDRTISIIVYDVKTSAREIIYKRTLTVYHKRVSTIIIDRPTIEYEIVYTEVKPGIYIWTAARKESANDPLSNSTFVASNTFSHNELIIKEEK